MEQNKTFISESKKTVASLQKVEATINSNESSLATKRLCLKEKQEELNKAIRDAKEYQDDLQVEIAKSEKVIITEDNVTEYVKAATELQALWLKQEAKRKSRDGCMQMLKKLYEDKNISLETFLKRIEKLATREFIAIYKKNKLEGLIRREEKAKA